jgi:hypothetical protein
MAPGGLMPGSVYWEYAPFIDAVQAATVTVARRSAVIVMLTRLPTGNPALSRSRSRARRG